MPHPSDSITISSWPHSPCGSLPPGLCRATKAIPPSPDGRGHRGKMVNLGLLPSTLGKERAGRKPHVMPTGPSGPGCSLSFGTRSGEKRSQGWLFSTGEPHVSRSSPATTATYRTGIDHPARNHASFLRMLSRVVLAARRLAIIGPCADHAACIRDRPHIFSTKTSRLVFRFRLRNCTRFRPRLRSLYGYASIALLCHFPRIDLHI